MIHTMKKRPTVVAAARQAGLTLIELTIVLLILIGLSGLLLPFVQGFVDKTHDSANADSLKEVGKQIESYNNLYSGYPENLDSLIVGTPGLNPALLATAATPGIAAAAAGVIMPAMMRPGLFVPYVLAGTGGGMQANADLEQFQNSGITKVATMWGDAGVGNHTLKATDNINIVLATGSTVAVINKTLLSQDGAVCSQAAATPGTPLAIGTPNVAGVPVPGADDAIANQCLAELLNKPITDVDVANNQYVVLGIGNDASLVGRTMAEAPIHFAKVGGMNAANKYNRILAVYELQEATMAPKAPGAKGHPALKFVGTLMPMMKIEGLSQAQGAYYSGDGA